MMTLSLSLSPSLSPLCRFRLLDCVVSSLDSRVIFGLYRPFRSFLMMYFDSDIHMTMECTYS
jgi:hypothetical protein